jgi:hypothetical protein
LPGSRNKGPEIPTWRCEPNFIKEIINGVIPYKVQPGVDAITDDNMFTEFKLGDRRYGFDPGNTWDRFLNRLFGGQNL